MRLKIFIISSFIVVICISGAFLLSADTTGRGTYNKDDSKLGGTNIANLAEWVDWPDHTEGHGTNDLVDRKKTYWECSNSYNCSLVGTFEEPKTINEIHLHGCYFKAKTKVGEYIPKDFEIWTDSSGKYEMLHRVVNNNASTDYKLILDSKETIKGIDFRALFGRSGYDNTGTYEFPCIEEIEIFEAPIEVSFGSISENKSNELPLEEKGAFEKFLGWLSGIF